MLFDSKGKQIPRGSLKFAMSSVLSDDHVASFCNDGKYGDTREG
jgi:hypothetical protein